MIKIGITGGIGSGKSVVASLLALSGVPVYIADEESKWLTNNSPVIREKLTALFGPEIYTNEGLNKKLLASHIFNNPEQLQQVNQIIHPEVNRHFSAWVERQTSPLCAIESAILFESGFYKVVDISLMVYAQENSASKEPWGGTQPREKKSNAESTAKYRTRKRKIAPIMLSIMTIDRPLYRK